MEEQKEDRGQAMVRQPVPDNIVEWTGPVTGRTYYRVRGVEMPGCFSPEEADRVARALADAGSNGYYSGGSKPKPKAKPTAAVAIETESIEGIPV